MDNISSNNEILSRFYLDAFVEKKEELVAVIKFNLTKCTFKYIEGNCTMLIDFLESNDSFDELGKYLEKVIATSGGSGVFSAPIRAERFLNDFSKGITKYEHKTSFVHKDTHRYVFKANFNMFQNPETEDVEGVLVIKNISAEYVHKLLPNHLYENEYQYIFILDAINDRMTANAINANSGLEDFITNKCFSEEVLFVSRNKIHESDRQIFIDNANLEKIVRELDKNGTYSFTVHEMKNGEKRTTKHRFTYLSAEHKIILGVLEDVTDIVERDNVTGGPNRKGFIRKCRNIFGESQEGREYSMVFVDLKGFKAINEIYGVSGGDKLLRLFYNRLNNSALYPLAAARLESDHFILLVQGKINYKELRKIMQYEYELDNKVTAVYARAGIYHIQDVNMDIEAMFDRARLAESYIENDYAKPYAIYEKKMQMNFIDRTAVVGELPAALKNNEFKVYYQPVINARTGKIESAEALVRWIHPDRGMISPGMFIPALEDSGHISEVDAVVIESVKRMLGERKNSGKPYVPITVNLSRKDFYDTELMNTIQDENFSVDIGPDYIRFEVTETAYSEAMETAEAIIGNLRKNGASIYLDDFGSGYSSFSSLVDYEFDLLKIDMTFVRKIGSGKRAESAIKHIIKMANDMDIKVVAEGAETEEQIKFLKENNCDYIQGYYYSKPMPEEDFKLYLDKHIA